MNLSQISLRRSLGRALTHTELDTNFETLQSAVQEVWRGLPGNWTYATATYDAGAAAYEATYVPAVTAYTDGQLLAFKADSTNTTSTVYFDANGVGKKRLVKWGNAALAIGDIQKDQIVCVRYDATAQYWQVLNPVTIHAAPRLGTTDLKIVAAGSTATITADEAVLKNSQNAALTVYNFAVVANISSGVGLNGLETGGTENVSKWYYIWLIAKLDGTIKSVLEEATTNTTAPAGPDLSGGAFAGYDYKLLIGAVFNDAGGDFVEFYQRDKKVSVYSTAATGVTLAPSAFSAIDLSQVVPKTAISASGFAGHTNNAKDLNAVISPKTSLGVGSVQLFGPTNATAGISGMYVAGTFSIVLQAQTLYWQTEVASVGANFGMVITQYDLA